MPIDYGVCMQSFCRHAGNVEAPSIQFIDIFADRDDQFRVETAFCKDISVVIADDQEWSWQAGAPIHGPAFSAEFPRPRGKTLDRDKLIETTLACRGIPVR